MADNEWDIINIDQKLRRLELTVDPDRSDASNQRRIKKYLDTLCMCGVTDSVMEGIKNNNAQPYPDIVQMNTESTEKHAHHGRRFETSMLMFKVSKCRCCGRTQPEHIDPEFPDNKNIPFDRKHLSMKYYTV